MLALRSQLAALNPPIKHELLSQGDSLLIILIDPARPARVSRTLNQALVRNTALLYEVIRDATNELRALSDHPAITARDVFPDE